MSLVELAPGLAVIRLATRLSRAIGYCAHATLVGDLLVDSGFRHARARLLRALDGQRIQAVVHTHADEDHGGNSAVVAARHGARCLASAASLPLLANPRLFPLYLYQRAVWGVPDPLVAEPVASLVEGEHHRLQAIPTPGHSADHLVYFEPDRGWAIVGDLYLGRRVILARPRENVADLISSLRTVEALRPARMICAHRGEVADPVRALEAKRQQLETLRGKALAHHQAGWSEQRILDELLGGEKRSVWLISFGDYSRRHFVRALLKPPGVGYRLAHPSSDPGEPGQPQRRCQTGPAATGS